VQKEAKQNYKRCNTPFKFKGLEMEKTIQPIPKQTRGCCPHK